MPDALTAACEKTGAEMVPLLMFVPCPASAMMKCVPPLLQLNWGTEQIAISVRMALPSF